MAARSYTLATLNPREDFDLFPDSARRCTAASRPSARRRTSRSARPRARCSGGTAGDRRLLLLDARAAARPRSTTPGRRRTRCRTSCRSRIRTTTSRLITSGRPRCSPRAGSARRSACGASATRSSCATRRAARRSVRLLTAPAGGVSPPERMRDDVPARLDRLRAARDVARRRPGRALFGTHVHVQRLGARPRAGAAPGARRARLADVAPSTPSPTGRFAVSVARDSLDAVPARLQRPCRRCDPARRRAARELHADGRTLRALVSPRLPLQVQRLTHRRGARSRARPARSTAR